MERVVETKPFKKYIQLIRQNLECIVWLSALLVLYFAPSAPDQEHFTICLFRLLGFEHCPGCGLGRSIHAFMHGNLAESWQYHWFGIPALMIILARIISLIKKYKHVKSPKPAYEYS